MKFWHSAATLSQFHSNISMMTGLLLFTTRPKGRAFAALLGPWLCSAMTGEESAVATATKRASFDQVDIGKEWVCK